MLTGYSVRHQCASKLYGLKLGEDGLEDDSGGQEDEEDIEASINREISNLKKSKSKKLIISIKLDIECGKLFPIKKRPSRWHTIFVISTVSLSSFYLRLYLLADMEAFILFWPWVVSVVFPYEGAMRAGGDGSHAFRRKSSEQMDTPVDTSHPDWQGNARGSRRGCERSPRTLLP